MKTKKLKSIFFLSLSLLLNVIFISSQTCFAEELHPTGLKILHEKIQNIKPAPKLYSSSKTLPTSIDLSGEFPDIGNQGSIGSCVGFAVGYADKTFQEGRDQKWNVKTNNHIFSPAYIYSQIHVLNTCDGGGAFFSDAFNLLQNQGCTTLDDMPYNGNCFGWMTQPTEQQRSNASKYKAKNWLQLEYGNYNEIKSYIAQGNPVVIGIAVLPDFDDLNPNNPIYDDISGWVRGYHALCVVGYDDSKKAIKIMNSWGTNWGLNGFGWISYDLIQKENVEAYVMSDIIDSEPITIFPALFNMLLFD